MYKGYIFSLFFLNLGQIRSIVNTYEEIYKTLALKKYFSPNTNITFYNCIYFYVNYEYYNIFDYD